MKKLLFTLAAAASFAAMAAPIAALDFESYTNNSPVVGRDDFGEPNPSLWSIDGEDSSRVKLYVDGDVTNAVAPSLTAYPGSFVDGGTKYLSLDTEGGELQRTNNVNNVVSDTGIYIDTLVQFTVTEDEAPDVNGAKLAIWLGVVEGVTNLYVQAEQYAGEDTSSGHSVTNFALVNENGAAPDVTPATWYRLTVKAIPNVFDSGDENIDERIPAFQILLDGNPLYAPAAMAPFSSEFIALYGNVGDGAKYMTTTMENAMTARSLFAQIGDPMRLDADATISCVGFKGTGAIDDFVLTTETPDFGSSAVDFTLTWGEGVSAVSYVLSADMATTNTLTSGTAAQIPAGTTGTIELIPTFESGYEFDYVDMGGTQLTLTFDVPTESTNATLVAKAAAAYPTYVGSDTTLQGQYNTWKATNGADSLSAYEKQFLLNVAPATTVADDALQIDAITENETAGWDIVVSTTVSGAALSDGSATTYNGYLLVKAANDLAGLESATPVAYPVTAVSGGKVSINVTGGKFMKVVLTTTAPAAE